ncbi:ABC transporter ATP-binding protein [Pengzhenrongella frigida]|uniref:ABC-type quaternary amine transporter n=1 Tax=Pengzhenrongella frigida TaxID=1259133 RepID=A0A4Q5MZ09_9MICO|nr:ABC transporter ATP-binding protein [Cellulomonas sp. HLT2-17]RYV50916.1 ABC transporter ATP-binding protein [Cellulomonas sp. HLT2-17]
MTALTIKGVCKSFGDHPVLDGVDLTVADGELTAVLGASGCGKTTLLRLIAGFAAPDEGTIALGDDVVVGDGTFVSPQRRRVGYVPQEGALFPHLDVAENIVFGLPRSERKAHHRVDELLELVGLDRRVRHRAPHQLSGGQQQRVALARALAPRPTLLLLDEPFSSLDAALRTETREAVVSALRAASASALLVTHDQGEAMSMADRIAIMRDGRIVQADAPAAVYGQPADAATARSVGHANVLEAQVRDGLAHTSIGPIPLRRLRRDGPAQILVRPEQVLIVPADGTSIQTLARVDRVHFYGHDSVVALTVLATDERVLARISGGTSPVLGATVDLELAGEAMNYATEP